MKNADAQSGASANVDSSRTYDAFGNLTGSSGTWSGPFGYAGGFGYQEDPDHGLRLLGHRYYDSSTGRFISKDPIGDGRNWYSYCGNNPLANVDPNGLHDKRVSSALWKRNPVIGKRYDTDKKFSEEMHRRMKRVKDKKVQEAEGKDKQRHNPDLTDQELGDIGDKLHADRPVKEAEGDKMQSRDLEERAPSYRPLPASRPRVPWAEIGLGVLVVGAVVLIGVAVAASGGTLAPVAAAAVIVVSGTVATRKRPVPGS